MSGWSFGFDPLSSQTTAKYNGIIFQTLTEKGAVSGADPESWKIHFRLPHNSNTNYFSNGFIVKHRTPIAVIAAPAPNILCGFIRKQYGMDLLCEHQHNHEDETAHFSTETGFGTLLRNERDDTIYFSLAVEMPSREQANLQASNHFTHTPEELIPVHESRRKLIHSFDIFKKLNTLPAIAGECLLKQLRAPEGALTGIWPASPALDKAAFSLNELYPLLTAWCDIDLSQARNIYDMALSLQRVDGHFPAWVAPSGDRNAFDAPHLFFAQGANLLLQKTGDCDHVKKYLPKLNNYMRWSLRHYLPQNALHPAGQSAKETFSPELWQKGFSSVEHCTLLICELEALSHLHTQSSGTIPAFITQALDKLTDLLEEEFWNPQTRTFSFCYLLEERATRYGLHEYLPLLHNKLDRDKRNSLLTQFKLSPWAQGLQADPETGQGTDPATPLQQFIILQCIKHPANPQVRTSAHTGKIWGNLMTWQQRYFRHKSSAEMPIVDTAFICLLIDLHSLRMNLIRKSSTWVKWGRSIINKLQITRDDLIILLTFSFLFFGTHMLYRDKEASAKEATIQEAHASYQKRDIAETMRTCKILLAKRPDNLEARLLMANLLLAGDASEEAERHYRKLRELDEDNPAFLLGLAMSLHRRGNLTAANAYYQEFQDYFGPYFPEISALVTRMQNLDTPKLTNYFIYRMVSSDFMLTL
ncbi:hypothetical protein ACFLQY_04105 [Verrucomicrobiota bacterium]